MRPPCSVHGATRAVAACALCARPMCRACARYTVGGRPACAICAYEISTRRTRRVSFAILGAFATIGASALVLPRVLDRGDVFIGCVVAVITAAIGLFVVVRTTREASADVRAWASPGDENAPFEIERSGLLRTRVVLRRVGAVVAPPLSARMTVISLIAASIALVWALPHALALPRIIAVELALFAIAAMLAVLFTTLLYGGYRLADDHFFVRPTTPFGPVVPGAEPAPEPEPRRESWRDGCEPDACSGCDVGCADEGVFILAVALVALSALLVFFAFAWAVVEVVVPLLFLAVYEVVVLAIRRVAHDRHGCEGDLVASMTWGAAWAVVYTLPIAGLVAAYHLLGGLTR